MENKGKLLAAGVLPICLATEHMLLSRRREQVDFGGTWASWGGKFESEKGDKTIEDCARREFKEETLIHDDYHFVAEPVHVYEDHRVVYYTFIGFFDSEVEPNVVDGGELAGYEWVSLDDIPQSLMPEFDIMLQAELPRIKDMIAQMKGNGKGE